MASYRQGWEIFETSSQGELKSVLFDIDTVNPKLGKKRDRKSSTDVSIFPNRKAAMEAAKANKIQHFVVLESFNLEENCN